MSALRAAAGLVGLPRPLTEQAGELTAAWGVFLAAGAVVVAVVYGLLGVAVVRYRRRDDLLPRQVHTRPTVEVAYFAVPLVVVAGLVAVTLEAIADTSGSAAGPAELVVEVVGSQWTWRFTERDAAGQLLAPPGDGSSADVPELVLPTRTVVRFDVTSDDVIHSFWVPGFLYKRDLIPGELQTFTVTTGDETGSFAGRCAEFCGLRHAAMRFTLRIVDRAEFHRTEPAR